MADRLEELDRASVWLAERMEGLALSEDTVYAVRLCVEEVLANIVTHAYVAEDGLDHAIRLDFRAGPEEVVVVAEDQGAPFDPLSVAAPPLATSIEEAAIGGLGLTLVKSFSSRLGYERRGDSNILTMGFAVTAG